MRLTTKFLLAFLFVALIAVASVAIIGGRTMRTGFGRFVFDRYREDFIEDLVAYYSEHGTFENINAAFLLLEPPPEARSGPRGPRGNALTLTNVEGIVLIAGFRHRVNQSLAPEVYRSGTPVQVDGETVGWIVEAPDAFQQNPAEQGFIDRIQQTLWIAAIASAGLALIIGILLVRTLTKPIRELTEATIAVASGDLEQRVTVRGLDELSRLAESFNRMSADLGRAESLRKQMTADIAHELRTPVSVILSHISALEEGVLPATEENFEVIREETERLGRLIEDLRTLSRVDAGEIEFTLVPVSPAHILESASRAHHPLASEHGIELQVDIDEDLPKIMADRDRIAQVFDNLIGNAIRYSPEGGKIRLTAREYRDGVEFVVSDSGPGINEEDLPRVFDRFYRADPARGRELGGSGLGLAITKSIVESHGGRIGVESTPGQGAAFTLWMPA